MADDLVCEVTVDPLKHESRLTINGEAVPGVVALETIVQVLIHFVNGESMMMVPYGFRHNQTMPLSKEMADAIRNVSAKAMSGE